MTDKELADYYLKIIADIRNELLGSSVDNEPDATFEYWLPQVIGEPACVIGLAQDRMKELRGKHDETSAAQWQEKVKQLADRTNK